MNGHDENNQESFSAEPDGLREVHESVHDALADADPTDQAGKPLLLTGFIVVIALALVALLVVALVIL